MYQYRAGFAGENRSLPKCVECAEEEKQHQQFANEESVRVLDYQQCIQATRTGNDQSVKADCDKVWQEIRSNNTAK